MKTFAWTCAAAVVLGACASSAVPADRLARSQAAVRSAQEVGAESIPPAALHLKIAQDQLQQARTLIADGRNSRASYVLMRAEADAEVAISLAREAEARADAQKTLDEVQRLKSTMPEGT